MLTNIKPSCRHRTHAHEASNQGKKARLTGTMHAQGVTEQLRTWEKSLHLQVLLKLSQNIVALLQGGLQLPADELPGPVVFPGGGVPPGDCEGFQVKGSFRNLGQSKAYIQPSKACHCFLKHTVIEHARSQL